MLTHVSSDAVAGFTVGTASTCRLREPVAGVVHAPFVTLTASVTVLPPSLVTSYVGEATDVLENKPLPVVVQLIDAEPGVIVN